MRSVLFVLFCCLTLVSVKAQERQVKSATLQQMQSEERAKIDQMNEAWKQSDGPEFKFDDKAVEDIGTGEYTRFVSFDFGDVAEGEIVEHDFTFTNVGNQPLIIENALASCGCTVPNYSKEPVAPGESGVIKVSFNTTGRTGLQSKSVTINSNAKVAQKVLMIRATVSATAAVEEK